MPKPPRISPEHPEFAPILKRASISTIGYDSFVQSLINEGKFLTSSAKKPIRRACHKAMEEREKSVRQYRRKLARLTIEKLQQLQPDEPWQQELVQSRIAELERRTTMTARQAFATSSGADTRAFRARLEKKGTNGKLAALLFLAQKSSSRAKDYRGGIDFGRGKLRYKDLSYGRKSNLLKDVVDLLVTANVELRWGWGNDNSSEKPPHVLYVDLPNGQVSFHAWTRHVGPNYAGRWDRQHKSEERILRFCDAVLAVKNEID